MDSSDFAQSAVIITDKYQNLVNLLSQFGSYFVFTFEVAHIFLRE